MSERDCRIPNQESKYGANSESQTRRANMAQTHQLFTISAINLSTIYPNTPSNSLRMQFSNMKAEITIKEHPFPPNAMRRKIDTSWMGGFSLGIDLGLSRTGVALSKGFSIKPLKVLELRGQKLEMGLLEIAQKQEVDEFIIGLPISSGGKETPQSNKVRSVAGRIAVRAAERGWRVYLQDEHGTSTDAMNRAVVSHTGYHPLALKVLGSHLCGRDLDFWQSELNILTKLPQAEINGILKMSFDELSIAEKKILLYIACFFKGRARRYVSR